MSKHPKTASAAKADQRLSQLIKLKRLEKPDAAYWEKFEQEFRSRQLTTFVHIQPMHTRIRRACMIIARKAAPPVAAAGAVALTFFAVTNASHFNQSPDDEIKSSRNELAPAQESEGQDAYFLVSVENSADSPQESDPSDTIYQVHELSNRGVTANGYQLNTTPVTFSKNVAGQTATANILSQQPNY
ncbi:hypothetical protein [Pelagicoccus sp. SDUM812002]|uniref:hypothetical protein n=1 Tax=Pelagicoccus sp. SDUM812002 TaxID=3041266 RepID=UPI00281078A4|nr:hypothetical protein [Pelagicoccus sp. SDUM812002]MDQ8186097.1 hypothetical protein [Pelagicoccus sp. SDUM812002]